MHATIKLRVSASPKIYVLVGSYFWINQLQTAEFRFFASYKAVKMMIMKILQLVLHYKVYQNMKWVSLAVVK